MRKVLAHLVAEMRKLGATIVAADMTSIILATGKRNLTAAIGWGSQLTCVRIMIGTVMHSLSELFTYYAAVKAFPYLDVHGHSIGHVALGCKNLPTAKAEMTCYR